jgi:hypothetical protein
LIHLNFNVSAIQSTNASIKPWCICSKILVDSWIVPIG